MKVCSLALVLLFAIPAGAAEPCVKDGILLFPAPGAVVPTNVQFILQGTGEVQAKVQALLSSNVIALVAEGKDAIQVKAEKGFVSQVSRVAIRLRPLKPLEPNVEYELARHTELTSSAVRFNVEARRAYLKYAHSPNAAWAGNFRVV